MLRDVGIGVGKPYDNPLISPTSSLQPSGNQPPMNVLPTRDGIGHNQAPPQSQPPRTNDENGGHVFQPPVNGSVPEVLAI